MSDKPYNVKYVPSEYRVIGQGGVIVDLWHLSPMERDVAQQIADALNAAYLIGNEDGYRKGLEVYTHPCF